MSPTRVVVSGCSGGGKSTLLAEMARRGCATFPEPGRQIVREEQASGGAALPWIDPSAFALRCLDRAIAFFEAAEAPGVVLFDRSIVDAVSALDRLGPLPDHAAAAVRRHRYAPRVFLVPPWPELFEADAERRHDFAAAVAEYDALLEAFPAWGYTTVEIPRLPVRERAEFLQTALQDAP